MMLDTTLLQNACQTLIAAPAPALIRRTVIADLERIEAANVITNDDLDDWLQDTVEDLYTLTFTYNLLELEPVVTAVESLYPSSSDINTSWLAAMS